MGQMYKPRQFAKRLLVCSGALRTAARCLPESVVVLVYHSIRAEHAPQTNSIDTGVSLPDLMFEKHMELLSRHFNPVSIDDVLDFVRDDAQLPPRSVAVTFDDGYADNFTIARPILNRYGIIAAFYVTVGSVDSRIPPWFVRLRHAFATTEEKEWFDKEGGQRVSLRDSHSRRLGFRLARTQVARTANEEQDEAVASIEAVYWFSVTQSFGVLLIVSDGSD